MLLDQVILRFSRTIARHGNILLTFSIDEKILLPRSAGFNLAIVPTYPLRRASRGIIALQQPHLYITHCTLAVMTLESRFGQASPQEFTKH
jgi:hypothetical protein